MNLAKPLRGIRRLAAQVANDEGVDALAVSPLGRLTNPAGKALYRNATTSLDYEIARGLALAFNFLGSEEVEGDYAEFGVWRGRTFLEAWRIGDSIAGPQRRFFAFDTFAGLPEPTGVDSDGRFRGGDFGYDRERFEARLRRAGIPPDRVHLVLLPFDRLAAAADRIPLDHVALAYVDSPLHQTTGMILDYLAPRLSDRAVVMFDAWYTYGAPTDRGQAGACAEWLARSPGICLTKVWQYHWSGQAFIFRRESDPGEMATGDR